MSADTQLKTPYYLYDTGLLEQTLDRALVAAGRHSYHIHYAIKANNNPVITRLISQRGLGADCVSGNEVQEAIHRGFAPEKVVYAGVGKSDDEIEQALQSNIFCFNCESNEELEVIEEIARKNNRVAPVALRVNPGVKAHTHHYITTGLEENKFGIHLSHLQQALDLCEQSPWLRFMGLHFHIGSQITSLEPFAALCGKVNLIWEDFKISSYNPVLVNLGGGLGVDYADPMSNNIPDFDAFFNTIHTHLALPSRVAVHFELGRSLVAQCGSLITRVLYVKKGVDRQFVVADAGMTELMRPALYQAVHRIDNISAQGQIAESYDVVGPVCESSDVFARDLSLPQTSRGDLLAIRSCGAYAESMMLRYNMRNRARACFVHNGEVTAIPHAEAHHDVLSENHLVNSLKN